MIFKMAEPDHTVSQKDKKANVAALAQDKNWKKAK